MGAAADGSPLVATLLGSSSTPMAVQAAAGVPTAAAPGAWPWKALRKSSELEVRRAAGAIDRLHTSETQRSALRGSSSGAGAVGAEAWPRLRVQIDAGLLSAPETVEFPTTGGRTAFMYFYPPTNGGVQVRPAWRVRGRHNHCHAAPARSPRL